MSLARNPNVSYAAAGQQERPFERMGVRSNVRVPAADVCVDCDGRPAYTVPAGAEREAFTIPVKAVVILVGLAMFVFSMLYVSALTKRASLYKEGQAIYTEMMTVEKDMTVLKAQLAKALEPNTLRFKASQLDMIDSKGKERDVIYAPETRPAQAETSLSAGMTRASID